jgi:hypothetical protein
MNKLYVGFTRNVELPKGGFLLIDDEVRDIPRLRIFDPLKHCFNPLKGIEYKKARELAELLYTVSPQGENTLTVRNGKRSLVKALLEADRLDKVKGDEEVSGMEGTCQPPPCCGECSARPSRSFHSIRVPRSKPASTARSWASSMRSCSGSFLSDIIKDRSLSLTSVFMGATHMRP